MKMDMNQLLPGLVDSLLPKFTQGKGLLITLNATYSKYETMKRSRQEILVLIYNPSNYTKVMSCMPDEMKSLSKYEWTLESDHDSCWRTDGFSFLRKFEQKIHEELGEGDISEFIAFGMYRPIRYVKINEFRLSHNNKVDRIDIEEVNDVSKN